MKQNKYIKKISIVFIAIAFTLSTSNSYAQSSGFEVIRSLEILDQIYENLDKYYVDDIETGTLSKVAIDAMLRELDPYTVYYHESNIEDYQLMTTGQYGGIGALIRKIGDYTYISEPYEDKPAHIAGLNAGDKILEIDGVSMKGKTTAEVSSFLKGPKATTVEVLVERQSEKKIITFERDEIKIKDVPYFGMINENVGYIKLTGFTKTAASEVLAAFNDLKSHGMEKLVFDLRGNGGGLLIEAVKIVNLFVEQNQTVVTTKGRVQEENRTYKTMVKANDLEIPVVVLVNGRSASASEIVSGTLQDLDRAVVVGTTTYGKGLVQNVFDLDYGSKIKITIAKYYTPSGRCVQRLEYYDKDSGVNPEEVPDSLLKVFKTVNGRDVIDGRGIEPDIDIKQREYSRLTANVFRENLIFNYATDYFYNHPEIKDANMFSLTDEEYADFTKYILAHDFSYSTASEEMLKKMKETAVEEGYYDDVEEEYNLLLKKVVPSKERDLEKFKAEIKRLLENEIVSRYYFQGGRTQQAFFGDKNIEKALEVLQDLKTYNTILGN